MNMETIKTIEYMIQARMTKKYCNYLGFDFSKAAWFKYPSSFLITSLQEARGNVILFKKEQEKKRVNQFAFRIVEVKTVTTKEVIK